MIYLSPDLQGRISLKESINLKREEDIDRPLLLSLLPDQTLWVLLGENSKRSKHSHKKRRRRSMTPSSSSNSSQSQLDIGRYTRAHKSPQIVQTPTPIQPEETNFSQITNQPINYDQIQPNLTQQNKESDSETESEVWSFDRAINEVFRLLPPELCPKTQQDQAPLKPLSGIEQLMESRSTPLLVLPQSKLVQNTTKYIQNWLESDKFSRDWICPQSLVSALAPTKFYKSQNQYLPTDNIPQLEADASLLDISNKGRASIPLKNLEAWERKARKLVAINSHADLFSSAAFLSLQQESMSVAALSRLLEAVAKSIKHATAMSTLLTTELFQARRDAALASSKLLLDNSTYELRNAPINSKSLFDGRIKEIAKSNFEAQQQRFLASTSIQSQSHSYKPPSQSRAFKIPKYPAKQTTSRPKPTQSYRSKNISQSSSSHIKKENIKRTGNIRQFPSSKPASSSARLWRPALSTACSSARGHSSGRTIGPFCGKMGGINRQQMGPLCRTKRIQDTIHQNSSFVICSDQNESILLPVSQRRDRKSSQQTGSGKGTESGNSRLLFPDIPCAKKERKVSLILDLSLLNRYIEKQAFKMETVKSVRQAMRLNDWAVSIDLTDAYLHVPIHRQSRKYLRFVHEDQVYHFSALPFGMSLSPLIFSKLMDVIAALLRQRAISVFPYLDDWLIKNLIHNRLITQTKICIQTIQSLGFLPNLKKSDLFPAQKFTFIGIEFLMQQNLVRVPADRVQNLILTIKKIMSAKHVSARTFLSLLGKLSAAADLVLLGRLHLRPLQMCLLSVWKPHIFPLDHPISINGMIRSHLQWWINPIRFETGTSIHPPDPKFFLYTDASHYGWGAHLEPTTLSFHGRWTENQSQLHINMLEMMAIRLALKQAKTFIHHSCIMISTDNTTVVSYINKQGGTHSPNLCVEVWKILNWCLEQDIVIRVRHIPGKFNILADRLSRLDKPIKTEWSLDQTVANSVFQMLNFPNVDLFATRFNHRLPLYVSPVQDYKALAIDALSMDWNHLHAYAFPPFILIPAVLEKIRQHQCRIVLIALFWPQQQWFSELLLLLVSAPIRLPLIPRLLTQSKGRFVHQNLPILDLHTWELSNNQSEIRNFHKTLQILSPDQEEHLHKKSTMQNGPSSLIGVIQKRLIRSRPLLQL